ncbi:3-oxoacyl-ACP reductase FabG [Alkalilimnicola sp. S0819]|uniref:3-oxoacyl-ACP reductase FabG n=1 Tax=Alkalilimnicola sp. S0819 TaxID=2613922 RepID=UPI001262A41D|nr:3-oxoacyl-ACP reductase FabG [Alkalilimnicola sp. S0819]KAB7627617.1 3-oxoacyl-ACP reductase FabG [Alkalilimnicola sp. S0819]MPQ15779.1 3-oxoacyl-ACP reductase FabG [Alkalilimnicola sp. S0819]
MDKPLKDQIALVTGASRGLGRAIAQALGAQGATVIGTATSDKGAEAIQQALDTAGITGAGMMLNVTDRAAADDFVKTVGERFGAPTILVNNAGITRDNLAMRMKDAEWDAVIETNLTAVFRLSKACLRGMMKARHGRVINIASVVGASGNAGQANYAAAKAGVFGLTKSLALELGSRGITVNAVAPGFIQTDMTDALNEEQRAGVLERIALGRLGQPEEIAAAVSFLASPGAAYITGETIHVNGGMYMN